MYGNLRFVLYDLMKQLPCLLELIFMMKYLLFRIAMRHWRCLSNCISKTLSWNGPAKKCTSSVLIRLDLMFRIIIYNLTAYRCIEPTNKGISFITQIGHFLNVKYYDVISLIIIITCYSKNKFIL
jgi:hypothetical protein